MLNASERKITRQWTGVMDDMIPEHEKEVKNLKKTVTVLMDIIASLTNRNTELEGQKKEFLHKYYEAAIPAGNSRPPARILGFILIMGKQERINDYCKI